LTVLDEFDSYMSKEYNIGIILSCHRVEICVSQADCSFVFNRSPIKNIGVRRLKTRYRVKTSGSTLKRTLTSYFAAMFILTILLFASFTAACLAGAGLSFRVAVAFTVSLVIWAILGFVGFRIFLLPLYKVYDRLTDASREMARGSLDDLSGDSSIVSNQLTELIESFSQINSSLNAYIYEISGILSHLSAGDMSVSMSSRNQYVGDFVPIKNALTKIIASLNQTFSQINNHVEKLSALSVQLQRSANALAQGSSEQAADIDSLSNMVAEIDIHTGENAKNAALAAQNAHAAKEKANTGNTYMSQLLSSMESIADSSNNISSIIKLINNIAFQTNILSLNASVEAARAGAAGKGFAVVANEVKDLAHRSAEAAKQTEDLIRASIAKVKDGSSIASKTAEVFEDIQSAVDVTSDLSGTIAGLSQTQSDGISRIASLICGISDVMEGNAANAQEVSAISDTLNGQADTLAQLMKQFRLKGSGDPELEKKRVSVIDKSARSLMEQLKSRLPEAASSEYDKLIRSLVNSASNIECIYLIRSDGTQVSSTVMSHESALVVSGEFKPAQKGDLHTTKKYFTKALRLDGDVYQSEEYISGATGGLCRTYSSLCQTAEGDIIICIDMAYPIQTLVQSAGHLRK